MDIDEIVKAHASSATGFSLICLGDRLPTAPFLREQPYKAVLFDLDGTLVDFAYRFTESKIALFKALVESGFDVSSMKPLDQLCHQDFFDLLDVQSKTRTTPSLDQGREKLSNLLNYFDEAAFRKSKLTEDTLKVLEKIQLYKIKIGLVSNSGKKHIERTLSEKNLRPYMDVMVTRDDVSRMKTSGEIIERALETLKVDASDALYVGDNVTDILSARDAGVEVAVIPGASNGRDLASHKPDYLLRSTRDLLHLPRMQRSFSKE